MCDQDQAKTRETNENRTLQPTAAVSDVTTSTQKYRPPTTALYVPTEYPSRTTMKEDRVYSPRARVNDTSSWRSKDDEGLRTESWKTTNTGAGSDWKWKRSESLDAWRRGRGGGTSYNTDWKVRSQEREGSSTFGQASRGYSRGRGLRAGSGRLTLDYGQYTQEGVENASDKGFPENKPRFDAENIRIPHRARLVEWTKQKPSELVMILANSRSGFALLTASELSPDILTLVVRILAVACRAEFQANKASILSNVCNATFVTKLSMHVHTLGNSRDLQRKEASGVFFADLLLFCETVMKLLPSSACEYLSGLLTFVSVAVASLTSLFGEAAFKTSLVNKLAQLQERLTDNIQKHAKKIRKEIKVSTKAEALTHQLPPDDFRDLSIFPTAGDILSRERAFVRPNIVEGAYSSIEHYLDVQFRLLREDFVWPLRDGIREYIAKENKEKIHKIDNIRIFKNAFFYGFTVVNHQFGSLVHFDQHSKNIDWNNSKRLMFGSLLCFTKDNFASVIFATVLNREVNDLRKGLITVLLAADCVLPRSEYFEDYVMVESDVFFPPYQHTLTALQNIRNDDFPMGRYIVYAQQDTEPPEYIKNHFRGITIDRHEVDLLDDSSWPEAAEMNLDESQFRALKSALTKEFVVIQGPPGTGKTFLALKIARTLIMNMGQMGYFVRARYHPRRRIYRGYHEFFDYYDNYGYYYDDDDDYNNGPNGGIILVVCFTNHALDQFLEGLLEITDDIVRMGGQSKSRILEEYSLKTKRSLCRARMSKRERDEATTDAHRLAYNIRARLQTMMSRIKGVKSDLKKLHHRSGIASVKCIKDVWQHSKLLDVFKNKRGYLSNALFLDWLEYGATEFEDNWQEQNGEDSTQPDVAKHRGRVDDDIVSGHGQDPYDDDCELNFDVVAKEKISFAVSFGQLQTRREEIRYILHLVAVAQRQGEPIVNNPWVLEEELQLINMQLHYYNYQFRHKPPKSPAFIESFADSHNANHLLDLTAQQRWALYHHWVELLQRATEDELRELQVRYRAETLHYEETKDMETLDILRKAQVVGMTTTMAAKSQAILKALRCPIVIVEEAAEVLESHIVVSLTSHCQHVILIGDHQQLRPTTAVHQLARDFNFDISLFERMLQNGLHCELLSVQHRMRPEIARLIVPAIYSELENHDSVTDFDPIRGVSNSVFFLHHENRETEVQENNSRSNHFEGDMLLGLCRYLLRQEYAPSQITILAAYSGQMFYMQSEAKKHSIMNGVLITKVDNYQGEENDIILLSLVRNNADNVIGFLKTENRVCVALSRAKRGLFIMGNMDNLVASSSVWPKIKEALEEQESIGDHLTLRCEVHPDQVTRVQTPQDFLKVPEGGCHLPCNTKLRCGHTCASICHSADRDHEKYKCLELNDSESEFPCGHNIVLPCHVEPETYKCQVLVATVANCGHTFDSPCGQKEITCPHPCEERLGCGHVCMLACHVNDDPYHLKYKCLNDCEKQMAGCDHACTRSCHEICDACEVLVTKTPTKCNHEQTVECHVTTEQIVCRRKCQRIMPCGHPCALNCSDPCIKCDVQVEKTIEACGHAVTLNCSEKAERKHCREACQRDLSCGHKCASACSVPCTASQLCVVLVDSETTPVCGHSVKVPCGVQTQGLPATSCRLLVHCSEPCTETLKCGHKCVGTCGSCVQGRIHVACREKCGKVLLCGHVCDEPCAEICQPCKKQCKFSCQHSVCPKPCGVPCVACKMKCTWFCEHKRCTKLCGQPCDREPCNEPCNEPCKKKLPCEHPCIGFCGEPCPPLCRVCDEEQVTTVLSTSHDKDEPDARCVYLVDCKHTVEAQGLDQWLSELNHPVKMPQCPICKTEIMKTPRVMNRVKAVLKDIMAIKKKVYADQKAVDSAVKDVLDKLTGIKRMITKASKTDRTFTSAGVSLVEKLEKDLQTSKDSRRNYHSRVDVHSLTIQVGIVALIFGLYEKAYRDIEGTSLSLLNDYSDLLVSALSKRQRMSANEVEDFNVELQRYQRVIHFCQLETKLQTPTHRAAGEELKCCDLARDVLFSNKRYTKENEAALKESFATLPGGPKMYRFQFVKAVGMKQGLWYKCPKGHFYESENYTSAALRGKCPDCHT